MTYIPLDPEAKGVAVILIEIFEHRVTSELYLGGEVLGKPPVIRSELTAPDDGWASGTEAIVAAMEGQARKIRDEMKKLGITVRQFTHLDLTDPKAQG